MANDNIAKISIIEGDSIETIKGQHTEYVGKMTYSSSQRLFATAENGKHFGDNPDDPPKTEGRKIDIIMFVAGTTDPVNTDGKQHQANTDYWRSSKENFWHKIKELKFQFLDLHIEGDFFSWSGDNDTKERNKASERLFDLLLRTYPIWKKEEVHLHLIGHSHGGNVINQFTELIANKELISKSKILKSRKITEFPKLWNVKSITYLSTPFFQQKHQLNHSKLHKQCKIINVHNEYDLTQRLVADFSLVNLEVFLKDFNIEKFQRGLNILSTVDKKLLQDKIVDIHMSENEARIIWGEMRKVFLGVNMLTNEFIKYIKGISIEKANLENERDQFVSLLNRFLQWTFEVYNNYGTINGYGKKKLIENLQLTQGISVLNQLFHINSGVKDSYLLVLLAKVFSTDSGVTDSIEITSWTPSKQAKNLNILDVNITNYDTYNSRGKKPLSEKFINDASKALQNNNLEEVLMRLFSQFIDPSVLETANKFINYAEYVFTGNLDTQLKNLRRSLLAYQKLISQYHLDLVTEKDKKDFTDMIKRPGTIPYLATASHSLSHTRFWNEVEEGLKDAFSSGKNPGFKKK